jgi:hypothetical protein
MSVPNPQSGADQLEAAADQAIAACGGDIFESSYSPETIKCRCDGSIWRRQIFSNSDRTIRGLVTKGRSTAPQSSVGSNGAVLPRKKPERCNLDHRSVECRGKSNPSDHGQIDLAQLVRCERATVRRGNGLRVPIRSQVCPALLKCFLARCSNRLSNICWASSELV